MNAGTVQGLVVDVFRGYYLIAISYLPSIKNTRCQVFLGKSATANQQNNHFITSLVNYMDYFHNPSF